MEKFKYCLLAMLWPVLGGYAQFNQASYVISGVIKSAAQEPLEGISILAIGSRTSVVSSKNGDFSIRIKQQYDTLEFSHVGFGSKRVAVNINSANIFVTLNSKSESLEEVIISTGFEKLPKERATGSFVFIDNELLNRRVSTNILDRLEGVVSGLVFNKNIRVGNTVQQANQSGISIRGRSTIHANPNPLIIVDNFPYEGDINNINPDDVENITILRDAAAASIWGAFSGNGVIVITTKNGKLNTRARVSFRSTLTVGEKPDLNYASVLSAADYIEIEKFLFSKNFYNASSRSLFSPVLEVLFREKAGAISSEEANQLISSFYDNDVRKDISRYIYRSSANQQYNINVSGGGLQNQYYFSVGYDHNKPVHVKNDFKRITLDAKNTFFINNRLSFSTALALTKTAAESAGLTYGRIYERLIDDNGNAQPIQTNYRQAWLDTVGKGKMPDWSYRPLQELELADNNSSTLDYRVQADLNYQVIKGLDFSLKYQYRNGINSNLNYYSPEAYFTRNLTNQFSQITYAQGVATNVNSKIPSGGILDNAENVYDAHNVRLQSNLNFKWNGFHEIAAIAGAEVYSFSSQSRSYRTYGYNKDLQTSQPVDYVTLHPKIPSGNGQIPENANHLKIVNRYINLFSNITYSYKKRYLLSVSGRKDASNLFGVSSNQKGIPLGSTGLGWVISKESFFVSRKVEYLKLRITNGYNGNLDHSASALPTAVYGGANAYGALYAVSQTPPNAQLRWEKIHLVNFGLDFKIFNVIDGSVEYFLKKGKDLLGSSPMAPQTGFISFYGNTADIKGKGWDITLNAQVNAPIIKWSGSLLFSSAVDEVTNYRKKVSSVSSLVLAGVLNPVIGKPLYAIYGYKWAGLKDNGTPQAILDGQVSNNYTAISGSPNLDNLEYIGPANPTITGSFTNSFSFKDFSLSFNILYKFNYFFRRPSINYSSLGNGHTDYLLRWQKPGDEKVTNVPALVYPLNSSRDHIYANSNLLVEKGDHIRLQDIRISYDLKRDWIKDLPFKSVNLYAYATNIGILWKHNKYGIDPDNVPDQRGSFTFPNPKLLSIGAHIQF